MSIALSIIDTAIAEPNLLWDTTWDGFIGDWAPASASEASNVGGFRARAQLATSVLLCLMSDRRAGANDVIADGSGDPRGWPGDAIDNTIAPLGSKLWLLRRSPLTEATAALAEVYARESLQTLVTQRAVASIDVKATAVLETGRLLLAVNLYKVDGSLAAALNFALLWDRTNGVSDPLAA